MPTFAAVLLFFTCFHSTVAYRRILHQPLFSGDSLPPIYSPPPPDYPFTTSDSQPDNTPLFPSDPSAPPPPIPATFASFPANVSSVTLPRSPAEKSPFSKLIAAAVAAVVAAVVVVSVAVFLQVRRRRGGDRSPSVEQVKTQRSDGNSPHRPPDRLQVPKLQRPSQTSSEFLYLGTLVNSQGGGGGFAFTGGNGAVNDDSHTRSMESPELQPLPPLTTRQSARRNYRINVDAATGKDDEDDEFYSPKGSVNGAESNIGTGSSSRRAFSGVRAENFNASTSNSSSIYSTTTASGSGSGSPARSGSLSLSPRRNPSPGSSIPKSPELIEIQNIAPMHRQIPRAQATAFQESGSPSPRSSSSPGGYSRQSGESSPRISTSSDTILDSPQLSNPTLPENPPISPSPSRTPSALPVLPPPPPPPPPPRPFKVTEFLHDKLPALNRNAVESSLSVEISSNGRGAVENNFKNESPVKEIELPSEATDTDDQLFSKPKLKPLHWDKVRASSDRKMVWDQLKCSSFKLNEEMIETLFVANTPNLTPKKPPRWQVIPSPGRESGNSALDPKKAQNIAILLKALNVTVEEVSEGLMEGNVETLGAELLEGLLKMAPTKEEERKLKEYNDASSPSNLGAAERFLKAIIDTPYAFKRAEAMIYASNFESEVEYLRKSYSILEAACEELRTSRMFLKILEAVLKTGNRMNVGTNRGDAHAFKLDTLLKLVDVKGADGKTTLLHFVVQEIIRTEGARLSDRTPSENLTVNDDVKCKKLGLQVVSGLGSELSNVKKAATMDSEVLSGDLFKLSQGLGSIHEVARLISTSPSNGSNSHKFCDSMNNFMKKAEEDIIRIQAQESVALSLVKEITEYFHGNSAKEEAHPFRIFVVVRDFLSTLDRVCKEVGMANERITILSPANKFPVPVNPMLQQQVPFGFPNQKVSISPGEEDSS